VIINAGFIKACLSDCAMRILIATGGTAGHILPALEVAAELRVDEHEVTLAGVSGRFGMKIRELEFPFQEISARGLKADSLKSFLDSCFSMLKSIPESNKIIREFDPEVVLGFGGYGAFPVVSLAVLLRRPTIIHEQNVVPGKANSILAHFVSEIAVSFDKSRAFFPRHKTIVTGCPCRSIKALPDRKKTLQEFGLKENILTVLVFLYHSGHTSFLKNFGILFLMPTSERIGDQNGRKAKGRNFCNGQSASPGDDKVRKLIGRSHFVKEGR